MSCLDHGLLNPFLFSYSWAAKLYNSGNCELPGSFGLWNSDYETLKENILYLKYSLKFILVNFPISILIKEFEVPL